MHTEHLNLSLRLSTRGFWFIDFSRMTDCLTNTQRKTAPKLSQCPQNSMLKQRVQTACQSLMSSAGKGQQNLHISALKTTQFWYRILEMSLHYITTVIVYNLSSRWNGTYCSLICPIFLLQRAHRRKESSFCHLQVLWVQKIQNGWQEAIAK